MVTMKILTTILLQRRLVNIHAMVVVHLTFSAAGRAQRDRASKVRTVVTDVME